MSNSVKVSFAENPCRYLKYHYLVLLADHSKWFFIKLYWVFWHFYGLGYRSHSPSLFLFYFFLIKRSNQFPAISLMMWAAMWRQQKDVLAVFISGVVQDSSGGCIKVCAYACLIKDERDSRRAGDAAVGVTWPKWCSASLWVLVTNKGRRRWHLFGRQRGISLLWCLCAGVPVLMSGAPGWEPLPLWGPLRSVFPGRPGIFCGHPAEIRG